MKAALRRHGVLGGLYLTQGIAYGFAGYVLLPNLAAAGVSLEVQAGVLATGSLPWIFKGLWAPILDRLRGPAALDPRRLAMVAQLCVAASLIVLAASGDVLANANSLIWAWFVHNVMLAIQDATADTLAIDILPASERGVGNGVMLGSRMLANDVLAPRLLGVGVVVASLEAALWLEAGIIAALAFVPLLAPWDPQARSEQLKTPLLGRLRAAFAHRSARLAGLIATLVFLADVVTGTAAANLLVQHLGWAPAQIGARLGLPTLVCGLAGYALATVVADRIGHARTAAVGSLLLGLTWVSFGLLEQLWQVPTTIIVLVAVQSIATALLYVGVHAALMDHADPRARATVFVIFMGLLNLPRAFGPTLAPGLLAALGYAGLFIAAGGYQLLIAAALPGLGVRRPDL
ncbi:AmpG permease [Enhygromyxa salina]|uniref:AmpG permease n=1 Tax=Enhygromyxa salina TaxID=215803 RepID=A0A0C2CW10_9BACT|nr:MFS transporter [Enhygromyxa salina]KIG12062.1 AmpG permease [Enhygromyxa salina]